MEPADKQETSGVRLAGYLRVSSNDQAERGTIGNQRAEIKCHEIGGPRKVAYAQLRIIHPMGSVGLCVAFGVCRWWGRS